MATEWALRRRGGLSTADLAAYQRWVAERPGRDRAVQRIEATLVVLSGPTEPGARRRIAEALARRQEQRRKRRRRLTASVLLAAAVAILVSVRASLHTGIQPLTTPTVSIAKDVRVLPDQSIVELGAGAEIRVDFDATERRVHLLRGEAYFSVTKDPAHPFVVLVDGVRVQAVGTQFAVRSAPAGAVRVLVTEGRVRVADEASPDTVTFLDAGTGLDLPVNDTPAPAPVMRRITESEMKDALAWRAGRVIFSGTPLDEAVALINSDNTTKVTVVGDTLAKARISGVFWRHDPAGFARLVEQSLEIRAVETGAGQIELRPR